MIMKCLPSSRLRDRPISQSWRLHRHWSRAMFLPCSRVWSKIGFWSDWSDSWSIDETCSNSWRSNDDDKKSMRFLERLQLGVEGGNDEIF